MAFVNLKLPEMTSRIILIKFNTHEQEKYSAFQYVSMSGVQSQEELLIMLIEPKPKALS